ncbi:RagB/SusD family nutrient uptake outer membrane protein [Chitinophaga arvensicola]|uniref:Starch-binding associating with outer membrane n=1 Tax=Chitinophaga arvensicola TaxID=29529 RepID=A0A1I0R3I2_9BACT|nr:RagB/SusD family nutrient uptake outer membrane protein [Chitinophaga arvensicola]SEW35050.1 Starch-binding associating with outer membrane [Chitinophaga arvensicola]
MNIKSITILTAAFTAGVLMTGCKKYLSVQPESSFTSDQVFTNERAAQQALNGIYNYLADANLYGSNLSTITIEILGQRYSPPSLGGTSNYTYLRQYNYTNSLVQPTFDQLWQKAYGTILYANEFIPQMDRMVKEGTLTAAHASQMKGEALAIRAMVHLDLLRLFGPVYSASPTAIAIPYYSTANGLSQPILPANQIMDSVLADFTRAEQLLSADPVITQGINNTQDFYSGFRNQRLNYYAVKALMARAYLWAGNNAAAHDAAQAVLTQGEKWFPWTSNAAITSANTPDRVYSPEILFGSYNQNMYTTYNAIFSSTLLATQVMTVNTNGVDKIFESNKNDYRYNYWFNSSPNGFLSFDKFKDIPDPAKTWRFVQPLVRKTELYYILAETDAALAIPLLDTVRTHRGLPILASSANVSTEIAKEYQKEFWGEGQLFFYYKRTNAARVPSGTSATATVVPVYVVPLPLSETSPR